MFQQIRIGRTVALVPLGVRRISGGLWAHSACRRPAVAASNAFGCLTAVTLRPLRTATVEWTPPVDATAWADWLAAASDLLAAPITSPVVLPPADPHRRRFALVLLAGDRPVGYAKWTLNPPNPFGVEAERRLAADPPSLFDVPALLDHRTVDGWTASINRLFPPGPHRPATLDASTRRAVTEEIHRRLQGITPGSTAHGDFAPWNVRVAADGRIVIIDWEDVKEAPVACDELWHAVTATLVGGGDADGAARTARTQLAHHRPETVAEAAAFLRRRESEEPPESDSAVARSASLLAFEESISRALRSLQEDPTPA